MLNRCKWRHVRINSRFLVKKKRKKKKSVFPLIMNTTPAPPSEGSCLVMLHQWACIKHVKWSSVAVVSPCRTTARSRRAFSWNTRPVPSFPLSPPFSQSSSFSPTTPPLAPCQPSLEYHTSGRFWEPPRTGPSGRPQETKAFLVLCSSSRRASSRRRGKVAQ